jgi:hypothetical protein
MPTPIPTTYQLYLDPLQGFTPGGTTWADQSLYENNFTFNNNSYIYENTIGSFYFPVATETIAIEDIKPGTIPLGTAAITIIAWVKLEENDPTNDNFCIFNIGRSPSGTNYQRLSFGNVSTTIGINAYQYLAIENNSGQRYTNSPADSLPFDTWKMVAMTKPASGTVASQKLYIDGVEVSVYYTSNGTGVVNTSLASGGNPTVRINNYLSPAGGLKSNGSASIGEFWIYDQELSAADLLNFYDVTQPRYFPPPPVVDLSDGRSFGQGFNG